MASAQLHSSPRGAPLPPRVARGGVERHAEKSRRDGPAREKGGRRRENRSGQWLLLTVLENAAAVSQPPFDATSFALDALWAE